MDCKEMILSDEFYDILYDYRTSTQESGLTGIPHCILGLEGDFSILYIDRSRVKPLSVSTYRYAYIPKCFGLLAPEQVMQEFGSVRREGESSLTLGGAYEQSGILAVQRPPLSLSGDGILIGFVDTGVRYWLDEFINDDGTSKIFSVWDQTQQEGTPPDGLYYGTEYTQHMLNSALERRRNGETDNLQHRDGDGHGTGLVSIALRGAPQAQVVMVKCRQAKPYLKSYYGIPQGAQAYAESDLMAGLSYLEQVAIRENKPLVICVSMGTNMGEHRGNSLMSRYIEELGNRKSRCVVVGGGNEGNLAHHFAGSLQLSGEAMYEDVEIRVSENVTSFSFELWGEIPNNYSIALRAPDGERTDRIPIRYGTERNLRFVYGATQVYVSYVLVERGSGSQLIFARFTDPTPGIWTVRVYAEGEYGRADYNMWLPMEAFLQQPVYFLRPDPFLTMTEPAYSRVAIGNTYFDSSNGSFAIDSGRGGQRRGETAPALAVAGVDVASLLGALTGSSASAALMAGAAALFMEWVIIRQNDPLLTSIGVRNYFVRGAVRDPNMDYPNATWGYGKMTIEGVFRELIEGI